MTGSVAGVARVVHAPRLDLGLARIRVRAYAFSDFCDIYQGLTTTDRALRRAAFLLTTALLLGGAAAPSRAVSCATTQVVKQAGGGSCTTISACVALIPASLSGDYCIDVQDNAVYTEQVVVQGVNTNGFQILIGSTTGTNRPTIVPPLVSTAAFKLFNASVTLSGLTIVSTNSVLYGVLASSSGITLSSVTVTGGAKITAAGVVLSTGGSILYSSVTVQAARALWLQGAGAAVEFSSAANNAAAYAAVEADAPGLFFSSGYVSNPAGWGVYVGPGASGAVIAQSSMATNGGATSTLGSIYVLGASSCSIVQDYLYDAGSAGVVFDGGASYNTVSQSTMVSAWFSPGALWVTGGSSYNVVTQSYMQDTASGGTAAALDSNALGNTISFSTIAIASSGSSPALYLNGASSNTVTGSVVVNPLGKAVTVTGAGYDALSQDVIVGDSNSDDAIYVLNSSSCTFDQDFVYNSSGVALYFLGSSMNTVSRSTVTSGGSFSGALEMNSSASSNVVTQSYVGDSGGIAADLMSGSNGNVFLQSVLASSGSFNAALAVSASSGNYVSGCLLYNPSGYGAYLQTGAANNRIDLSTVSVNNPTGAALYFSGTNQNAVSRSVISNPWNYGADLETFGTGGFNTISLSTITSVYGTALYLTGNGTNTVSDCYVQGATAAYVSSSPGDAIRASVLVVGNQGGRGLWVAGTYNFTATSVTILGTALSTGVYFDALNNGALTLSSDVIEGVSFGLSVATPGSAETLSASSVSFQGLQAGATAVQLLGGTLSSTFTSVSFDATAGLNVNAAPASTASAVVLLGASGARAGPGYQRDPSSVLTWYFWPPLSPSASSVQTTSMTVTYGVVNGAAGYQLDASTSASFAGTVFSSATAGAGLGALSVLGLSPNTTYYLRVGSVWGAATSYASVPAAPLATLAAAPAGLAFGGVSTGALTLTWSASGNGAGTLYTVLTSTAANPSSPSGAVVTASATYNVALTTAGLGGNATYYFQVAATNFGGIQSAFSAVVGTATAAAPPSGLAFGAVSTGAVTLTWSASGNGPGTLYTVLTSTAPNPSAPAGAVVTASATYNVSLSTTGLGVNTTYFFRVAATGAGGVQTAFTAAVATATLAAQPSGVGFGGVSTGAVTVSWSASGNGPGTLYTVLTSTAPNPSVPAGAVVTASATYNVSLSTAGLRGSTTYYFQIAATNVEGVPTAYTAASATATFAAPPSGVVFSGVSTGAAVVSWSASGNGSGALYTILASTAPDPLAPAGAVVTASTTYNVSLSTAGLGANATYYVRVAAANPSGTQTAYTAAVGTATPAAAPSGTAASAVYQSSAALAWSRNGNPAYTLAEVQRSTDGAAYSRSLLAAATSFLDASLSACSTYYFRVRNLGVSGTYTVFDAPLQLLTAPIVPHPAEALTATPAAGGRVSLTWNPSPTAGVTGYKLYYDAGTGTVSYTAPLAVFAATETSFVTAVLPSSASYAFALRADHACGNEETAGVFAAAASTALPAAVSAFIRTPDSGKRVAGNSLTVVADLSAGTPDQIREIEFQYRPSGAGAWTPIPAANVNHPNPVLGAPYFIQWNAGALAPGSYDLRAQAVSVAGSSDAAPSAITIIVDPAAPDISESVVAGRLQKAQTLSADIPNTVQAADAGAGGALATIQLPAGALSGSSVTLTTVVDPAVSTATPPGLMLVGSALQADLGSGQHLLQGGLTAAVTLSYPATVADPSTLQIYAYDPLTGAWSKDFASTVDTTSRTVTGLTPHLSVFVLLSGAATADLSGARAYPVPYKPNGANPNEGAPYTASDPNSGIIFDRLPSPVSIKIYTMTGRLVTELADSSGSGRIQWDVRTGDGRGVASGGYIAVISAPGLKSVIKKLAVIR